MASTAMELGKLNPSLMAGWRSKLMKRWPSDVGLAGTTMCYSGLIGRAGARGGQARESGASVHLGQTRSRRRGAGQSGGVFGLLLGIDGGGSVTDVMTEVCGGDGASPNERAA